MAPKYEIFQIVSANGENSVDIFSGQFRVLSFSYYESIISPHITGSITINSSTSAAESQDDAQGRLGSLYSSLPLRPGCTILTQIKNDVGCLLYTSPSPRDRG